MLCKSDLREAFMPPEEYEGYREEVETAQQDLEASIPSFNPLQGHYENVDFGRNYETQSSYPDVPFRDESKGDFTSTVASSGCGLLVTRFIDYFFCIPDGFDVPTFAEKGVELGYRGYKQLPDGKWKKMGLLHAWFDRFVPSYNGLKCRMLHNINEVNKAIFDQSLPVLLVRCSVNNDSPESTESHFVAVVGSDNDEGVYYLYDPKYDKIREVPYYKVNNAVRKGWIFSEA